MLGSYRLLKKEGWEGNNGRAPAQLLTSPQEPQSHAGAAAHRHCEGADQRDGGDASGGQGWESGLGQIVARLQPALSTGPCLPPGSEGFDSPFPPQMEGSHRY